jgi:Uma2 family endonuclease
MSYEDFLRWAGDDTRAEWVNGKVIVQMPTTDIHQLTLGFLYTLLTLFAHMFQRGLVFMAPYAVRLEESLREPDILFVANENLEQISHQQLTGPADIIVEIISDDSVQRDRRDKFREYRQAGAREYWIIDPRPGKQRADFFRLTEACAYDLFGTEEDERVSSSVLPGFWLRPSWLWQAADLDPFPVFCEITGLPAEFAEQVIKQIRAGVEKVQKK